MTSLLTRLESLTAPSREVSDELLLSWGWRLETLDEGYWRRWTWPNGDTTDQYNSLSEGWHIGEHSWDRDIPHPTASIDDALLGVPEGMTWDAGDCGYNDGVPWATITGANDSEWPQFDANAATVPLALCIAIVKARGGV